MSPIAPSGANAPAPAGSHAGPAGGRGSQQKRAGSELPSPFAALAIPQFRWLQVGNVLSNAGYFMGHVAQSWLVYHLTESPWWVGLHTMAAHGPVLLVALPAGAMADRVNKRRAMMWLMSGSVMLAALFALLSGAHLLTAGLIVFLAFLEGLCLSTQRPFWSAATQDVVGRTLLTSGIACNSASFNLARMLGPAAGGVVLEMFGPTTSFVMKAFGFMVVLHSVYMLRIPPPKPRTRSSSILADLSEAIAYNRRSPALWRLTWSSGAFSLLLGPVQGLMVVFSAESLQGGAATYGKLLSCLAIGAMVGAWVAASFPRWVPRYRLIPLGMFLYGCFGVCFSLTTALVPALICVTLAGIFHSTVFISSMTAVQLLAPDAMRGRLISIQGFVTLGLVPLGSLIAGLIAERTGAAPTITGAMLGMMALGAWTLHKPKRQIDQAPPVEPSPA